MYISNTHNSYIDYIHIGIIGIIGINYWLETLESHVK